MQKENLTQAMENLVAEIVSETGSVKPEILIKKSKPKSAKTHKCFEWDDQKAGHEYRLIQARHWIRVITIQTGDKETGFRRVRLAHVPSMSGKANGEYKPLTAIVESPSEFERALSAALSDLRAAQDRVAELKNAAAKMGDDEKVSILAALAMTLTSANDILSKLH